jgi:hypothetical protein
MSESMNEPPADGEKPKAKQKPKTLQEARTWRLQDAVELIEELRPELESVGWTLGLTGSVLFRGESTKDLDLIVYPLNASIENNKELVRDVLIRHRFRLFLTKAELAEKWKTQAGSTDTKHVEVYTGRYRRLDLFFLS